MMTFGDNIKNIIILLPNEGHESPEMAEEARLINQPYVPENIVASPGIILFGLMVMLDILTSSLWLMRILMRYILVENLILIL